MKKRLIPLLLIFALTLGTIASAAQPRATTVVPSLSFNGTTANCSASITDFGGEIKATLTLWNGNRVVDSWYGEGTSVLRISGSCKVTEGVTYSLKVTGTVDGVGFAGSPVYGTCPANP